MEKVAVVKYDATPDALRRAIGLCGGFEKLKTSDRVLVKPNIVWGGTAAMPPFGIVTTSTVVRDLILLLREFGCSDIGIGEGTIVNHELGSDTLRGCEWSGIARVAKDHGVKLIDFNGGPFEEVRVEGLRVGISRAVREADFLINLPVLKTHCQTRISLGMKNLKGVLALPARKRFHAHNLPRLIALLNTNVAPQLTVIDGIYALERGPEFLGRAHRTNLLIAGTDVFSCDVVGASAMGIGPEEVAHLKEFARLQNRSLSVGAVAVQGERIENVSRRLEWRLDLEAVFRRAGIRGIVVQDPGTTCCSGCAAVLSAFIGAFCKDSPGIALEGVEVCVGRQVQANKESAQVFLVGDCAVSANRGLADAIRVPGCPPRVLDTMVAVTKEVLPPARFVRLMTPRLLKYLGTKMGMCDEAFPAFGRYEPPEFDRNHF
ncbi:MAG: DUF362 domain-containing protein [Syntrophales bacterium]